MKSSVSPDRAADQQSGTATAGRRRAGRRRWAAAGLVIVVAAGGLVAAALAGAFGNLSSPSAQSGGNAYPTSTAAVTRRSLSSQTLVNATLGYAGSYSVMNQAQGTLTWLPAVGKTIREGRVLYRVDGKPVALLYGRVPAYRPLSEGVTGADVRQLNADLVKLGYATRALLGPRSGWRYFSAETAHALEKLQTHLGVTATGTLAPGQAVFLPGPARITGMGTGAVAGGSAMPGSTVMTASSVTQVVTINLDASQQSQVKKGDRVTITLPDGKTTAGLVASVGRVATASSGGSGGSGGSATVTVKVTLDDPAAAGHLDQAPVTVAITTGIVHDALVVPVNALLARPGGGYAVEVAGATGHHLVTVTPGMFDDAHGLVQVSGAGLAAGQRVVVPAP